MSRVVPDGFEPWKPWHTMANGLKFGPDGLLDALTEARVRGFIAFLMQK